MNSIGRGGAYSSRSHNARSSGAFSVCDNAVRVKKTGFFKKIAVKLLILCKIHKKTPKNFRFRTFLKK